jgi:hypothetical protein
MPRPAINASNPTTSKILTLTAAALSHTQGAPLFIHSRIEFIATGLQ